MSFEIKSKDAAINRKHRASDMDRPPRCQERRQCGNLVRFSEPPGWNAQLNLSATNLLGRKLTVENLRGMGPAGCGAVDRDAVGSRQDGQGPRPARERCRGRRSGVPALDCKRAYDREESSPRRATLSTTGDVLQASQ